MDDLIRRQAAIEVLERELSLVERPITETRWFDLGLRKAQDVLSEMPSAQPKHNGEWIRNFDGDEWYWFCSNCKEEWYEEDLWMGGNDFPNFCPNCGARMKGEQDEI